MNKKSQDVFKLNKGFIHGLFEEEKDDEIEESQKYSFLAEDNELNADATDFTDSVSLLRRQKKIIANIEKHQNKTSFNPMKVLKKPTINWMLILCHGGKFAMLTYQNDELIKSKTESKYVCRGKQGGRQLNADKTKSISSLGS